jgi:hypothetical protein
MVTIDFKELAILVEVEKKLSFGKELSCLSKEDFIQKRLMVWNHFASQGKTFFSRRKDDFILGFVQDKSRLHITDLRIANPISIRTLSVQLLSFIKSQGIQTVTSKVYRGNKKSLDFHKCLGFKIDLNRNYDKNSYFHYVASSVLINNLSTL